MTAIDQINDVALRLSNGVQPTPKNLASVAAQTSGEAARWAFTQWELRKRAQAKFERANEMLFTREALEQASHESVAAWRATRFPHGALVADLTCGIGSDLIALAKRGPAMGFELDPERAAYARHNLSLCVPEADVNVVQGDSIAIEWDWNYAIADPSRRVDARRTLNPEDFQPNPLLIAERMARLKLGCIKLSPLLQDSYLETLGSAVEFISFGGECREAAVWCGQEATRGWGTVHVESGERLEREFPTSRVVEEPESWFYEADPAAIRADVLPALCKRLDLSLLGDSNGYLTGVVRVSSPWLTRYQVLGYAKGDRRATLDLLHRLDARVTVVKSRAKGLDVMAWLHELRTTGATEVVVAFYHVGRSLRAAILTIDR